MRKPSSRWVVVVALGLLLFGGVAQVAAQATPPYQVVEVGSTPEVKEGPGVKVPEFRQPTPLVPYSIEGMALTAETEPNDTAATAAYVSVAIAVLGNDTAIVFSSLGLRAWDPLRAAPSGETPGDLRSRLRHPHLPVRGRADPATLS